jgi:tRNA A22 N-methylase
MKQGKMSERLKLICDHVLVEHEVWDICCDHALIALSAFDQNSSRKIYAVDKSLPAMEQLKQRLAARARGHIQLICEDACALKAVIKGTVIIAGVGGDLIEKILTHQMNREILRIIVSPNKDEEKFLLFMDRLCKTHHFSLSKQQAVIESGKHRNIFIFDQVQLTV